VAGTCNPASGACSTPAAAYGSACSDGNACTQTDTCQAGLCTGANPVVCTASDQCHVAGTCNPASGACSNPAAANGTTCSDGNACTQTDTCQAGLCTGANPVVCTASDQCHLAGTCDPTSGACSNPHLPGACCGDGVISGTETCDDGNTISGDGCSATCQTERGYVCTGAPSHCGTVCGDGVCAGSETGATCPQDCWLRATAVAAGEFYSCAILAGGSVRCWGQNADGELGIGDTTDRGFFPTDMGDQLPRVKLGNGRTAVALAAGKLHACAILDDGSVKCWGGNPDGELGIGDTRDRGGNPGEMGDALPRVALGAGRTAIAIAIGELHTCALLDDHSVKCWGVNAEGQLGLGDTRSRGSSAADMGDNLPAVDLGSGHTALALGMGSRHSCAILDDHSLKCWGYNPDGQLGLGDMNPRGASPGTMGNALATVSLGTGRTALTVVGGYLHTCAVLDNHALKCWGANAYGALGLGIPSTVAVGSTPGQMGDALSAVNLGTGRTALDVVAGYGDTCALLDNQTLKCWGQNWYGMLGLGDTQNRGASPSDMGDNLPPLDFGTGRTVVAAGRMQMEHDCALLDDGSLKCWGDSYHGEVGSSASSIGSAPGQMGDANPRVALGLWTPCGDDVVTAGEACDDGDKRAGDGCSPSCTIEIGWVCSGSPSDCSTVCGDGMVVGAEQCDDGNLVDGDGCSPTCTIDPGWICTGSPSACRMPNVDLAVSNVSATADGPPPGGVRVNFTVCNVGTDGSETTPYDLALSSDSVVDLQDPLWGVVTGYGAGQFFHPPVPPLDGGQCWPETLWAPFIPPMFGTYWIGPVLLPPLDINPSNNVLGAPNSIAVGPDLAFTSVDLVASFPGQPPDIDYTLCNIGNMSQTQPTPLDFLYSTDPVVDPADPGLSALEGILPPATMFSLQPLGAGACTSGAVSLWPLVEPPQFGSYWLGAIVYPTQDLNPLNNVAGATTSFAIGPDLAVTAVSAVADASVPNLVDVSYTVCDQGNLPDFGAPLDFLYATSPLVDASAASFSAFFNLPPGQFRWTTPYVDAGGCTTGLASVPRPPGGPFWIGAVVHPAQDLNPANDLLGGNTF
jgi:cysteine-rich repeat protein